MAYKNKGTFAELKLAKLPDKPANNLFRLAPTQRLVKPSIAPRYRHPVPLSQLPDFRSIRPLDARKNRVVSRDYDTKKLHRGCP